MMLQRLKHLFGGRRIWLLLVPVLLVGGVLAALFGRRFIDNARFDPDEAVTIPVVETGDGGAIVAVASSVSTSPDQGKSRLLVRLSQGQAEPEQVTQLQLVSGIPLPADEQQRIIDRLPPLPVVVDDTLDFNLPSASLPPPRTGQTINEPFPPPAPQVTPSAAATGPLELLRYAPEGEIPLAPFLNATFNQPMVPLTTLAALSAEEVPVKLTPSLPGTWKWIGTQTLTFEYASALIDRFPMATEYVAEVPAGTTSATGGVLAETVRWTFSTPPPQVQVQHPQGSPQPLDPLFFVAFDQRIEPAAVLASIQVTAGGRSVPVRLATEAEIEADESVSRLSQHNSEGRWLAFRASQSLPADSDIQVSIGPGTPSAEGPLTTETGQGFSFHTYAPLHIQDHRCGWYDDNCPPLSPFFITFNNPIDESVYDESMLQIQPALPGVSVDIQGSSITIRGATQGRTTYRVRVDGALADIFGQTLGQTETLTFRVGSATPALSGPPQNFVTLDPSATKPVFSVYSINFDRLQVRAYAVAAQDWPDYLNYLEEFRRQEKDPLPPGREVMDESIEIDAPADALTETPIDLSQLLNENLGHLILIVEPPSNLLSRDRDWQRYTINAWVQATQIGLDAFTDYGEMVVWASALKDGAPLSGVSITSLPDKLNQVTGDDGTARFGLPSGGIGLLIANQGSDTAILPGSAYYWDQSNWQSWSPRDELRWHVFDDRQMYLPGEEVHVKGWLRQVGGRQDGDITLPSSQLSSVRYQVTDPQGNDLADGQVSVSALGGFDLAFELPENSNLGYANLILNAQGSGLDGSQYYHSFQIQEFRRPEFEVIAGNETTGPYFVGGYAVTVASANYYAGGPLPNAEVTWQVSSSPGSYAPPNWPDFTFGTWTPWWFMYGGYGAIYEEAAFLGEPYDPYGGEIRETFSGVTDAAGNHYLRLDFDAMDEPQPFSVVAEATVMDVNRQAWSAATTMLVHPADLYIGIHSARTFVEQGTPLEIEAIVTDLDGNPIADHPLELRAARMEWKFDQGRWQEKPVEVQECKLDSTNEPVICSFETTVGGTYRITAEVRDGQGRLNQSQFTRWVSGGQRPPARNVEMESVTLIPDKETYQPGQVAEILVQAPFSPAEGLLTVGRSGILYTESFHMSGNSTTLRVPIEEKHLPNLSLQVDLVGAAPRSSDAGQAAPELPPRPAYATATLNLSIPPLSRALALQAIPRQSELAPGEETTIDLVLTDANNQPVADAELAVVVVDEAILALTNYQLANPLNTFYQERPAFVNSYYGRTSIVLANPQVLADQMSDELARTVAQDMDVVEEAEMAFAAPMATEAPAEAGAAFDQSAAAEPIQVRSNFNPLATFAPSVRTDGRGQAQVVVQLPDNLTRYRVMVVAVAGSQQFGSAEANLTARLPLMVRPSAPRFLNFGDQFELPVVVQNQTGEEMAVDVVLQTTNLELLDGAGVRVTVPAHDRVEVRFPAKTVSAGTARYQLAAVSGSYADAASGEMPVYTPATTEAFATYGVIDEGAIAQPVLIPGDLYPQFGGLEIQTSSTALQALTDAVLYLASYRYECSEQLASRIMAIAALRDVLAAFSAEGLPSVAELEQAVQRDIARLEGMQNGDGGFPIWQRDRKSIPYYSIYVAHAMYQAQTKGFVISPDIRQRSLDYLRNIENHYPHWYSQRTRWSLSAYALYVRQLLDDGDGAKALNLYREAGLDNLSLEAAAWLWQVLDRSPGAAAEVEAISRHLNNRAVESAGAANFTTSYGDEAYLMLHSDRRTDGVILDALIAVQPQSDLIPKVVNGLLAHRTRGRWDNTQENTFILLALDRYFNTFEAETPEFVARIWLGDTYVGDHEFVGRSTDRRQTDVPMNYLVDNLSSTGQSQDLILSKEGPGRLYYRLGLRYAPTDLDMDPVDMGFIVQRIYEAVDDPADVSQDSDGVWHIKAGARVRVKLTMVADNRRYHVALVDPLPAGLEIVNPALAVSGDVPEDPNDSSSYYGWWWWSTWYEHQNMRDERAEAFTSLLWEGVHTYSYLARATTPGTFVVPPAKAEEMYSPEVFGRSDNDWVIVD